MTNYREILRLNNLGILKQDIAKSCACSRNTAANVIKLAGEKSISWEAAERLNNAELAEKLFPGSQKQTVYRVPDWNYIHREMAKSGAPQPKEHIDKVNSAPRIECTMRFYARYLSIFRIFIRLARASG